MFVTLAGGVDGTRLAYGSSKTMDPGQLTITINVGDEFEHQRDTWWPVAETRRDVAEHP